MTQALRHVILSRESLVLPRAVASKVVSQPPTIVLMDIQAQERSLEAGVEVDNTFFEDGERVGTRISGKWMMTVTDDLRYSQGGG